MSTNLKLYNFKYVTKIMTLKEQQMTLFVIGAHFLIFLNNSENEMIIIISHSAKTCMLIFIKHGV